MQFDITNVGHCKFHRKRNKRTNETKFQSLSDITVRAKKKLREPLVCQRKSIKNTTCQENLSLLGIHKLGG